ncbi:hypothetical protein ACSMXM_10950 [Pacificimonas sp. ICDLI1SI03]
MPLDPNYIRNRDFAVIETAVTDYDVILCALSIWLGTDPVNARDLRYVYEQDLHVFPTTPLVIGNLGNWIVELGTSITRSMVVHEAQRLETLRQLPIGGTAVTRNRVTDVWDKGAKGAIIEIERTTNDKVSGDIVAIGYSSVFCRADGAFGGASGPAHKFLEVPDRAPDHAIEIPTRPTSPYSTGSTSIATPCTPILSMPHGQNSGGRSFTGWPPVALLRSRSTGLLRARH